MSATAEEIDRLVAAAVENEVAARAAPKATEPEPKPEPKSEPKSELKGAFRIIAKEWRPDIEAFAYTTQDENGAVEKNVSGRAITVRRAREHHARLLRLETALSAEREVARAEREASAKERDAARAEVAELRTTIASLTARMEAEMAGTRATLMAPVLVLKDAAGNIIGAQRVLPTASGGTR